MTQLDIRSVPKASTPETRTFILGNLPEENLLDFVRLYSEMQNEPWMRAVVDSGALDTQPDLPAVEDQSDLTDVAVQFAQRLEAMTLFMRNVQPMMLAEDETGTIPGGMTVWTYQASLDLKVLFAQTTERVVNAYQALKDHPLWNADLPVAATVHESMALWASSVCVMNMPDELQAITDACPAAMTTNFEIKKISSRLKDFIVSDDLQYANEDMPDYDADNPKDPITVNALFAALTFSRPECMQVLFEAGAGTGLGMVVHDFAIPLTPQNLHTFFQPMSGPSMHAQLVQEGLKGEGADEIRNAALQALNSDKFWMRHIVQGFAAAGAFDHDPNVAVHQAVTLGHPSVVQRLIGNVDWNHVHLANDASPILLASHHAHGNNHKAEFEKALSIYLEAAQDAGFDAFNVVERKRLSLAVIPSGFVDLDLPGFAGQSQLEPVTHMARAGFSQLVTRFLENGLDIHQKVGQSTFIETIDQHYPDVANDLRSFVAASKAREAIDALKTKPTASP